MLYYCYQVLLNIFFSVPAHVRLVLPLVCNRWNRLSCDKSLHGIGINEQWTINVVLAGVNGAGKSALCGQLLAYTNPELKQQIHDKVVNRSDVLSYSNFVLLDPSILFILLDIISFLMIF